MLRFARQPASLAAAVLTLIVLSVGSGAARAADAPSIKIALVNTQRLYRESAEAKAIATQAQEEDKRNSAEVAAKNQKLQDMHKTLGDYKQGTPQFNKAMDEYIQAAAEAKISAEVAKMKLESRYKGQVKRVFDRIGEAVAKVAAREGVDLVIADDTDRLPDDLDKVDLRTLNGLMLEKRVMYASKKPGLDITSAVLLQLDADYKAAAPAPAPAPAPGK